MRVRGSRKRVHLTEVDLEPAEQKPMLRVAPAAASLIWLGSIGIATAIYMEWLPARALFAEERATSPEHAHRALEPGARAELERVPRALPRTKRPALSTAPAREASDAGAHAAVTPALPPALASEGAGPLPRSDTITTPAVVPESSRTIRGSYYSDDSNWAGGW